MSKTKGELVNKALSEIGLADYEFDITPEEITSAIREMDSMVAMWSAKGLVFNYPFGDLSGDTDSGIPDVVEEAVTTNLAMRLASSYGKQPPSTLPGIARTAMTAVYSFSARPREQQFATMPRGAGHKNTQWPFQTPVEDQYPDVPDNDVDLSGGPDGGT